MPNQALPTSQLVNVKVSLNPQAAQAQSLNDMLVIGSSPVIDVQTRVRTYNTLQAVGADFGNAAPEYTAALLWFQQAPQPARLYIGRYAPTGSKGQLIGGPLTATQQALSNFTAVTNGGFQIQVNGGAAINITGLNFSAASNLNGVAAIINTAGQAATSPFGVTWDSVYQRFVFSTTLTGATASLSYTTAPTAGTDLGPLLNTSAGANGSYPVAGIAPETALGAATLFDGLMGQQFYGLTILGASLADNVAVANYIEAAANYHFYGVSTQDANCLNAAVTTDVASALSALNLTRSAVQYSSTSAYSVVSLLARILTTNYTAQNSTITLMYKTEPGIVPESLTATQSAALKAKNCNVFAAYNNNTAIIQYGVTSAGAPMYIDTAMIMAAFATSVQAQLFNRLYGANKIPQTDIGMHTLITDVEAIALQFVGNGAFAPGVWQGDGFGSLRTGAYMSKGYYVYAAPIATQSSTARANRISVPIQVAAKLAGAIHTISASITIDN